MPNELNRKLEGTILKGHRHHSVKHDNRGIKSFMNRDLISGSSSFPKETKDFQEKMIESICIKKWCLVIGGQREKHQFFHMKLSYWSAFNQAIEVAADSQRFLAFLWFLKNQCLRSVSREKFAGEEVRKKFQPKFPPGGLSMPKPLEYIPWSPRNIFALNLIFYKYILFCLKECLSSVFFRSPD